MDLSSESPNGAFSHGRQRDERQMENPIGRRLLENGEANGQRRRTLRVGFSFNVGNQTMQWNHYNERLVHVLHEASNSMYSFHPSTLPRLESWMSSEQQQTLLNRNVESRQMEEGHVHFEDITRQMQRIRDSLANARVQ